MILSGVLLCIDGVGLWVQGRAGCGKSSAAYALLKDGRAQLVSDDAVCLQVQAGTLVGRAPQNIAGLLYVRGRGMLSVAEHFGAQALCEGVPVRLRVQVRPTQRGEDVITQWQTVTVAGLPLAQVCIPQGTGQELAAQLLDVLRMWQQAKERAQLPPEGGYYVLSGH